MLKFLLINLLSIETWVVMGKSPNSCVFKLASLYLSLLDMGLGLQRGQHVFYINILRSTLLLTANIPLFAYHVWTLLCFRTVKCQQQDMIPDLCLF